MNIVIIIAVNLALLGLLIAGFFTGKNNGWYVQLAKFGMYLVAAVGLFFLLPVVIGQYDGAKLIEAGVTYSTYCFITYALLFMCAYAVITVAFIPIKRVWTKKKRVKFDKSKYSKAKDKDSKLLLKEREKRNFKDKKLRNKVHFNHTHKVGRMFGGIFGVMSMIVFIIVFMFAFKAPLNDLYKGAYDYSFIGVLDNLIDGSNKVETAWDIEPEQNIEEQVYNIGDTFDVAAVEVWLEPNSDGDILYTLKDIVAYDKNGKDILLDIPFEEEGKFTVEVVYENGEDTIKKIFIIKVVSE